MLAPVVGERPVQLVHASTERDFGDITSRVGIEQLDGIPIIVYFDRARGEAKRLWESLKATRMKLDKLEPGLGTGGAHTVVHSAGHAEPAEWIRGNVRGLAQFKLATLSSNDSFEGVIVNLW